MSLIRKHGAVLQAWACLDLVPKWFPGEIPETQFNGASFGALVFKFFPLPNLSGSAIAQFLNI